MAGGKKIQSIDVPLVLGETNDDGDGHDHQDNTSDRIERGRGCGTEGSYAGPYVSVVPSLEMSYSSCATPLPHPERPPNGFFFNSGGVKNGGGFGPTEDGDPNDERKRDVTLDDVRKQARAFWEMAMPYFRESSEGRCLFGTMIFFCLLSSGLSVIFSFVLRDFWSALSERNEEAFRVMLGYFSGAVVAAVPVSVMYRYQKDRLALKWREWMTARILELYFKNRAYYGLESASRGRVGAAPPQVEELNPNDAVPENSSVHAPTAEVGNCGVSPIDNPDQRVTEDVKSFTVFSLTLFIVFVTSGIDMVLFSAILYSIYPSLFYTILIYATIGTFLTYVIGKKLVRLNFTLLKREADFRYSLVRFRENAESIAFYAGELIEGKEVSRRLDRVVSNKQEIISAQRSLACFTISYEYLIQILPIVVVAPLYFAGTIQLGVVSQSAGAFFHILEDVSVIVTEFENLSAFSAGIDRLVSFLTAIREADDHRSDISPLLEAPVEISDEKLPVDFGVANFGNTDGVTDIGPRISVVYTSEEQVNTTNSMHILTLEDLTLVTPDLKRKLIRDLNLSLRKGQNLLITGMSGAGKSSLLRAISGLWSAGSGIIRRPTDKNVFFLPQKPYCPLGTLRDQVLYPSVLPFGEHVDGMNHGMQYTKFSDTELLAILKSVGLKSLAFRVGNGDPYQGLDTVRDWGNTLSLGEQQRIAFARVFVNRPSLVVLDESTSALDMRAEEMVYELETI
mmetsp:Transcript_4883/g.9676  ORF Transcript_4883/g.9676 Transcript_4883/m.9676 type:complete len:736 (-) Transcript_4883:1371-3578(-)